MGNTTDGEAVLRVGKRARENPHEGGADTSHTRESMPVGIPRLIRINGG